ncbi:MAG: sortase, partial [Anaerolineaceae bacterium]|nr:sortase [Anaerolineaceae bacterium]
ATPKKHDPGNKEDPKTKAVPVLPVSGVGAPDGEKVQRPASGVDPALRGPLPAIQRLEIPSIGVDAWVKPVSFNGLSWDISSLVGEVAWLAESAYPWEHENTVLTAHVRFKGLEVPFQSLPAIENGSMIYLYTARGTYTYRVRAQEVVDSDDLSVLAPSGSAQLTLITCANWDRNLSTYTRRQVVIAGLVDTYTPPPAVSRGYLRTE